MALGNTAEEIRKKISDTAKTAETLTGAVGLAASAATELHECVQRQDLDMQAFLTASIALANEIQCDLDDEGAENDDDDGAGNRSDDIAGPGGGDGGG